MSRLVGGKPVIEIDKEVAEIRPAVAAAASTVPARRGAARQLGDRLSRRVDTRR